MIALVEGNQLHRHLLYIYFVSNDKVNTFEKGQVEKIFELIYT